jgi:aminoglycoside phosphotransferase (APT) family kinase protein
LIRLHSENMIANGHWTEDRRIAFVDEPLAAFDKRFGTSAGEAALFDATRAIAVDLLGQPLPVVWEHGDYTIWNIFRDGDRLRVLDWEHSRVGVPLADMIRLATHWHEAVRGLATPARRWQGFADLFAGGRSHPAANEALAAVLRYEEALHLDPRFRSMILVMSRVQLAVRRFEFQLENGILQDDVRAGNAALAYISALVERRGDLFPARPDFSCD